MEKAYFAGGCFWCITPTFREMDGVADVISGYSGGDEVNPTYEDVKNQKTGEYQTKQKEGFDAGLVEPVLARLVERGYVDDERFAKLWIENRSVRKGISQKKLRLELQSKGISQDIIDACLSEGVRDEHKELEKVIAKKAKKYPDEQKLIQYLLRQGFNYSDVLEALSTVSSSE